jgi:hypothetical protein
MKCYVIQDYCLYVYIFINSLRILISFIISFCFLEVIRVLFYFSNTVPYIFTKVNYTDSRKKIVIEDYVEEY